MIDLTATALLAEFPGIKFPGIDGFIPGSRATIMLDVVFVAMFAVVPVMAWGIWLVRSKRNYLLHKRVQLTLATVLLLAVTAFEIDMQLISGWRERAEPSPYYAAADGVNWVMRSLYLHLFFAVPTAFLWVFVVVQALRKIPNPPRPCTYSPKHKFWSWIAAGEMTMTAITGWIFYWLAFMAK
jgi:putative membrane protein